MARPDRPARRRAHRDAARGVRRRAVTAALALGVTLLTSALTAGCAGLRMESAEPTTPSAGPVEQVRQRSAQAAAELAAESAALLGASADAGPAEGDLRAAITAVGATARTHLEALGGVWQPFPSQTPAPTGQSPSPSGSASPAPATVAALLADLTAQAAAAHVDATTVEDGRLARLLASIGLSRELQAAWLARAAGLEPPAPSPAVAPDGIPAGLSAEALAPAIASEDALGAAWELEAARSSDAAREAAAAIAAAHRATAQAWARAAGVDATPTDPRRAGYQLDAVLTDPASAPEARTAVLAGLEDRLAAVWLDLVASAAPDEREPLVAATRAALARAVELAGAAGPALPGIDPVVALP